MCLILNTFLKYYTPIFINLKNVIMKERSFIVSLGLMFFLFLGMISCNSKNEVEEPSLTLDKKVLEFTKAAGELSVNITTNQSSWVATSPADGEWLELQKTGDRLIVKATANDLAKVRKSYVLINAGGASEVISIIQVPADINLELMPEIVEIP